MTPRSIRRVVSSKLTPQELWEFVFREDVLTRWLGSQSLLHPRLDTRFALDDGRSPARTGIVESLHESPDSDGSFGLRCRVHASADAAASLVYFTVSPPESGYGSQLQVRESGLSHGATREQAISYWADAAARLQVLASEVHDRRTNPRQALVVIHGIGEQRPGDTLTRFVDSGVFDLDENAIEEARWVKPDWLSRSYELRRAVIPTSPRNDRPNTEVYELYWAHLVRDTTQGQVIGWLRSFLFRKPQSLPVPLRKYWALGWVAIGVAVIAYVLVGVLGLMNESTGASGTFLGATLVTALLGAVLLGIRTFGRNLTINVLGDAARYFQATPDNVSRREAIRQAGVDLLVRMHESGRYDRIIVVGHSLGSVVAYDILTFAWQRMYRDHSAPRRARSTQLRECEKLTVRRGAQSPAQAQHLAWCEHRRNTQPWLVTDLVTLGSPLTHADALVADSSSALQQLQSDRVLPTCPPVTSAEHPGHRRFSFESAYLHRETGKRRTMTAPHHAAPFALTRWTNLYFKAKVITGDPVGGPISPLFGAWVTDVPLAPPSRGLVRFAHTKYFSAARPTPDANAAAAGFEANQHLQELSKALRLDCRTDLVRLAKEMPAHAFLRAAAE
ncbi:MAG: hypothetical protein M3400_15105 [Actinomycetota bacterium]|nr:hypothetical protein [Actinomycetota bacterium]